MIKARTKSLPALALLTLSPVPSAAQPEPEKKVVEAIRTEGLAYSQAMQIETELTDGIGARLTGSPAFERGVAWAVARLRNAHVPQVHVEDWGVFGEGWTQLGAEVTALDPAFPIQAQATPWSPGTDGPVAGPAVLVSQAHDDSELAQWRGYLRGKVVLYGRPPKVDPDTIPTMVLADPEARRRFAEAPAGRDEAQADANCAYYRAANADERAYAFFAAEGALAVLRAGGSGGALRVDETATMGWRAYQPGHRQPLPSAAIATESYGRIARLIATGDPVRLRVDLRVSVTAPAVHGRNVIAEIPGTDPAVRDQMVMLGAHLDSWTAGTGATDDGAGVAVAMEAMRILQASGVRPRRSIRIALWGGEEQGTLGSLGYVRAHLGRIDLPSTEGPDAVPLSFATPLAIEPGPGAARIHAYFNMDKGAGMVLGVATRGNLAAADAARAWLPRVADLGFDTVSQATEAQVDSDNFARLGVPVFDLYQSPRDDNRTHHTSLDTLERVKPADLVQAATVMAVLLYLAANGTSRPDKAADR